MYKPCIKRFLLFVSVFVLTVYSCDKDFYKDKKVLVTGGCGFIGSHLVEQLVNLGAIVTILDNLSTGSLANIAAVRDCVTLIEGDITNWQDCLHATQGQSIIFHLAALTSVQDSLTNPQRCFDVNVHGTSHILEAARMNNVERFIFSSSAAVYGNKETMCKETDECHPLSPYGLSKLIGELLCRLYCEQYGIKTLCLRYFNVYGERQNPQGSYAAAVPKFRHNMAHNLPITIFGDGLQTRDFVPVDFIVQCNSLLASIDDSHLCGQACNVATGESITILSLVDLLKSDFPHYNASIMHKEALLGEVRHSCADTNRLQFLLQMARA